MTTAYRLNVRVFWPLVTCAGLLCLWQALRRSKAAGPSRAWDGDDDDDGAPAPLLKGSGYICCRVSLAVGPGRPLALHIAPRSDYVCCHLSMAVRLIPAIPLGEALYLTPLPSSVQPPAAAKLGAFWTLNVAKQEQRLLGWLREQAPEDSCHLKCLQILKGLRDLGGRSLEQPLSTQWSQVLSSYLLKTALFWLLLRGPLAAWEDQFLVERLEDLVLFLVEGLQRRRLMHLFLGNPALPEALSLPKILKEAPMVNLLADFDGPTLDRVAAQLLDTWKQAPKVIGMYSGHRYWRKHPV
nr:inositol 1,4,5-trisphosphate receptor-interacting protein-like 2 [Pogona vitticeps]